MSKVDEFLDYLESLLNEIVVLQNDGVEDGDEKLTELLIVSTMIMTGLNTYRHNLLPEEDQRCMTMLMSYRDASGRF